MADDLSSILGLGTNISEHYDSDDTFYWRNDSPVSYTYFSINIVMIVAHLASIALNSCMIVAIRRSRKIDEPSGHCLITLSTAYIWHAMMMIYTGFYGLLNMQEKNECLIRFGLTHSSFILVSWANCLLTFDRYLQIELPFWYKRHICHKSIWKLNFVAALLAVFFGLSTLIFNWYRPKGARINFCEYFNVLPTLYLQMFYIITFSGFPFIIAAYTRLLYIAKRHKTAIANLVKSTAASEIEAERERRPNWRPVKLVLTIFTVYLTGWAPPGIFGLVLTFDPLYPKLVWKYHSITAGLIMIPSISGFINPCMYTLHREVKLRFLQVIKCDKRFQQRRLVTETNLSPLKVMNYSNNGRKSSSFDITDTTDVTDITDVTD